MSLTKNLNHLNLSNCDINEDLGSELLSGISSAKQLVSLSLQGNSLRNGGISSLTYGLKQNAKFNKSLTILNLSKTEMEDGQCIELCSAILKHSKMQILNLSDNLLSNKDQ